MDQVHRIDAARDLMLRFAASTGLLPQATQSKRYLWTDAFAVCNFIALWKACDDIHFRDLAVLLVEQVHGTLGRHRVDDQRRGWISGLDEDEGAQHPTAGGLRICKELPERSPGQRYEPDLEWDHDGQYLHYLTKWMHALCRLASTTGKTQPRYGQVNSQRRPGAGLPSKADGALCGRQASTSHARWSRRWGTTIHWTAT